MRETAPDVLVLERTTADVIQALQLRVGEFIACSAFFERWKPAFVTRDIGDRFLRAFDYLVATFPSLIALATARLGERGRVVLAKNLYEECGDGDPTRTHHAVYRRFLLSTGLQCGSEYADQYTVRWRSELNELLLTAEPAEVVGVIAAGEVLAQPALKKIYDVLMQLYPGTDVEYFTTHLELETNHVSEIANLIVAECRGELALPSVLKGFERGLASWREWFDGMSELCKLKNAA